VKKTSDVPEVQGLAHLYIPTGRFEEAWKFWTEVAGAKAEETWKEGEGEGAPRSGRLTFAGQSIVLGSGPERAEHAELGYPVLHGAPVMYFSTPDVEKLASALAARGAKALRGPLTTHWGAKAVAVKAGDAVVVFVEPKKAEPQPAEPQKAPAQKPQEKK
jgi:uncharacterized glyoxalase superfamily protein PhnB